MALIILDIIDPQIFNKYPFSITGVFLFIFFTGVYLAKIFVKISLNLKEMTINLDQKVQERTQKLEQANEQKISFFINLAHETKTPLTLISNYLNKDINNRGASEDIRIVKQNIDKLINDMVNYLDIEKLEKGIDFYHHDQAVEVSSVIRQKIMLFKEIAGKKSIKISQKIPAEKIYARIDPHALDRAMNNLLDNAVRYTDRNGKIRVTVQADRENLEIRVKDTGKGIPQDQQDNIFQPYYQASHEKSNIQGIGMGLAIVKKIIDSVSGHITVNSAVDQGTEFRVTLRRACPEKQNDITKYEIHKRPPDTISTTELDKVPASDKVKYTVLLVEDNKEIVRLLQDSLQNRYNFFYALNGKQGLTQLIHIPKPNLIIVDIMMDVMNGIEFYDNLISVKDYRNIPVIFLTAKNIPELKIEQIKKGAIDYIAKPFELPELLAKIDAVINSHEKMKEQRLKEIMEIMLQKFDGSTSTEQGFHQKCKEYSITRREKDTLRLIKENLTNKEIAFKLGVSESTIKTHVKNLLKKCHAVNRDDLISLFSEFR